MWYTLILDKLFGSVTDYFKDKQNHIQLIEQKKMELEVAKVTSEIGRVEKQQDSDNAIDIITIGERGWKDDIITYLIISPFAILVFNPLFAMVFGYDPQVIMLAMQEGFVALHSIPDAWWWGLLIVFSDVYGLRTLLRSLFAIMSDKLKNKLM